MRIRRKRNWSIDNLLIRYGNLSESEEAESLESFPEFRGLKVKIGIDRVTKLRG